MQISNKWKRRIGYVALFLILSLAGSGCGVGRQSEDPAQMDGTNAGSLSYRYFL